MKEEELFDERRTHRRRLEDRLFISAFEESPEPLVSLDGSARIYTWSRGAADLLSYTREEALQKEFGSLFVEPAVCRNILESARAVAGLRNFECLALKKDGSKVKVFLTIKTLTDSPSPPTPGEPMGGVREVSGYVVYLSPALVNFEAGPENKLVRDVLLRMERFSTVGQMTAAFAHDIRSPLHVISSTAEFALEFLSPEPKVRESLEMIVRNAQHAATSIKALLEFARAGRCRLQEALLNSILSQALLLVERTCEKQGIRIEKNFGEPPVLMLDPNHIQAVAYNLFANAIDAMPSGGMLRVTTEVLASPSLVHLLVEDTGAGMPPEVLAKISEPFFTTKEAGVGLGLYLTKRILAEHDAEIKFQSEPGEGTRASIFFKLPKR